MYDKPEYEIYELKNKFCSTHKAFDISLQNVHSPALFYPWNQKNQKIFESNAKVLD